MFGFIVLPAKKVSGHSSPLRGSDTGLGSCDMKPGRSQVKTNGTFTTYMQVNKIYGQYSVNSLSFNLFSITNFIF